MIFLVGNIKYILIKSFGFVAIISLLNLLISYGVQSFVVKSVFCFHSCIFFFFLDSKLFTEFSSIGYIKKVQLLVRVFCNAFRMQFYNLPFFVIINSFLALLIYALHFLLSEYLGVYIFIHSLFIVPIYSSIVSNFYIKNKYEHFNLYKEA